MAITPLRIPNLTASLPIVDDKGRPTTEFLRRLNDILQGIAKTLNAISALPEIQAALVGLDTATQAALDAAAAAQTAADSAQGQIDNQVREATLANSYIDPDSVISSTSTTITVLAHTRYYGDGTSVSVNGGMVSTTAVGDIDFVYYLDPTRTGGAVTYIAEANTNPAQTGDTHVVGAVTVPATGTVPGGNGPQRPGYVQP
jgi:hypothetical protein